MHAFPSRATMLARFAPFAAAALLACGPGEQVDGGTGTNTPPPALTSVVISPSQFSVSGGDTVRFHAAPLDADGHPFPGTTLSWSATAGTIDQTGLFTAARVATTATITVTAGGEVSDTATGSITLTPARVASVSVSPGSAGLLVGQSLSLTATPRDSASNALIGRSVTWSTNAPGVATVTQAGVVTALATGSATITATSEGVNGTSGISVSPVPVDHVVISPPSASLVVGQTQLFAASPRDANDQPLTGRTCSWSSGNAAVVTVNAGGLATALAAGNGSAIATCESRAGTATITVSAVPVASVTVTPNPAAVVAGSAVQLTATTRDAGGAVLTGRAVTWSSNATGVATVSGTGLVTGVAAGAATITATSEGRSGSTTVNVTASGGGGGAVVDTVFYDGFESGSFSLWQDRGSPQNQSITTSAANVYAGTRALQVNYPAGADGGWLTRFFMPGYDSVFVRYRIKLDANWTGGTKLAYLTGSRIDNQWSAFGKAGVCPNGTDFFAAYLYGEVSPQMGVHFYTYHVGMPSGGGCFGYDGASSVYSPDHFQLTTGVWHSIEFWVKLNTPGQANGLQQFWIDGTLRGNWPGITWRNTTDLRLNAFTLSPNTPFTTSALRTMYIDEVLVTRQKP